MESLEQRQKERFVQLLTEQVGSGVYVWGGNGEILDGMADPKSWIERHEQSKTDAKRALRLFERRKAAGKTRIRAFDCSGLVYWALKTAGVRLHDVSAAGLYELCRPLNIGEQQTGDLLFHHNGVRITHVGVCVGEEQIECKGRDEGVVKNRRRAGYWNRAGRFPAFERSGKEAYVRIRGGSVRVREDDHTGAKCVGIAHRGERFKLLGTAPSGWYKIEYHGAARCITNRARYTEVVYG